jgi:hypothetical protein
MVGMMEKGGRSMDPVTRDHPRGAGILCAIGRFLPDPGDRQDYSQQVESIYIGIPFWVYNCSNRKSHSEIHTYLPIV